MTIQEIASGLPNGFHDAEIKTIRIDYGHNKAEFELDVWVGTMDDPPVMREAYRKGILTINGLLYCAMDVPDERCSFANSVPLTIDLAEPIEFHPDGAAFACRFWVNEWNAFIHLSGMSAELEWQESAVNRGA
jgi:hypothetical protein